MAGSGTPAASSSQMQAQARDLDLAPVVRFLHNSLAMKAKGDATHYNHLVAQLLSREDQETLFRVYLGLSRCVEEVCERPDEYKELVDAIFRFDWNHPPNVSFAYQQLLTQLVSANSTYLLPALHTLVRAMLLRVDEMDDSGGGARERRGSVHSSLQTLLYLVPSGGSKLFPVLSSHYPHKRRSGDILADYARQLLEVLRYMPSAQGKVLQLIIEKCLEIDVEIKIMDNGEAVRDEEEGEGDPIFNMDDLMHGRKAAADGSKKDDVNEMADKLDGLMLVLFAHVDEQFARQDKVQEQRLFAALMCAFEDNILVTHRCKYVQYVVFYACGVEARQSSSKEPQLGAEFVRRLLDMTLDDTKPAVIRQMSAAYLGSYLARASYLSISVVDAALSSLLLRITEFLDSNEALSGAELTASSITPRLLRRRSSMGSMGSNGSPMCINGWGGGDSLKLFYSFCQSAFYIMCFHGATLTHHARDHARDWERVLRSRLNPLRHSLETVRREFARLCCAVLFDGIFPADLLGMLHKVGYEEEAEAPVETVTSIVVGASVGASAPTPSRSTMAGGLGSGSNPLDSFFPFDPYLLRRSHAHVSSMYNYWHGGVQREERDGRERQNGGGEVSSSDDSDSEEEDDEAEEEANHVENREDMAESMKLANSLLSEAMSFTPKGSSSLDDFHQAVSVSPATGSYSLNAAAGSADAQFADEGW